MAEVVDGAELNGGRGFTVVAYDWSLWLNGQAWKAVRGIDYQCSSDSFAASVYASARRRGVKVKIKKTEEYVVFRAHKETKGAV